MSTPARSKLPAGLYALCDDTLRPELGVVDKARLLIEGGVKVLQLRLKQTTGANAAHAARSVAELCRGCGVVCIINDRADWALLSGADGVHVGEHDLPPAEVRELLGAERIIGVTCRGLDDISDAEQAGADYAGVGPVFDTTTKQVHAAPLGLKPLAELVASAPLPIVAIAGINVFNMEAVARTGVHGAAVGSDLFATADVPARVRALSEAFARGRVSA